MKLLDDAFEYLAEFEGCNMDYVIGRFGEWHDKMQHDNCELHDYIIRRKGYEKPVQELGYSREVLHRLAKRGAIVIDGVVYAPVMKRERKKK